MATFPLNTSVAGLKYQAKQMQNGGSVFVKNSVVAYQLTDSAFNEITDIDYPSRHSYTLSSLTSASLTATGITNTQWVWTGVAPINSAATFPFTIE